MCAVDECDFDAVTNLKTLHETIGIRR